MRMAIMSAALLATTAASAYPDVNSAAFRDLIRSSEYTCNRVTYMGVIEDTEFGRNWTVVCDRRFTYTVANTPSGEQEVIAYQP